MMTTDKWEKNAEIFKIVSTTRKQQSSTKQPTFSFLIILNKNIQYISMASKQQRSIP